MVLTLVLVPVMYSYVEDVRRFTGRIFKRKSKKTGVAVTDFEPALALQGALTTAEVSQVR
jgi:hypothetical protein